MSAKKYKLLSAAVDGGMKVCAFFLSPDGCRNGDQCKFLHSKEGTSEAVSRYGHSVSDDASVVSSESEGEIMVKQEDNLFANQAGTSAKKSPKVEAKPQQKYPKVEPQQKSPKVETKPQQKSPKVEAKPQQKKQNKRKAHNDDDDVFANPKKRDGPLPGSQPPIKKQKQTKAAVATAKPKQPAASASPAASAAPDFRNLFSSLPIASFSTTAQGNPQSTQTQPKTPEASGKVEAPTSSLKEPKNKLPQSTAVGRKWQKTVLSTREHDRYDGAFNFSKYKDSEKESGLANTVTWIKAKPYGPWCASNPQVIAIDCEMCESQDPLSGAKNPKALCRVSIVNAENPDEVLLDTLVKPDWPVTDYRARINGITKEHLEKVEFTLRHCQAFMMALCSEETVIVGHAVDNDLCAMNMEHYCVADSAYLFRATDNTSSSVSLRDLVSTLFQKEMPNIHDSVNDARMALDCVVHYVEKDGIVESIERTPRNNGHQLFIHRIPKQCKQSHLSTMFFNHTDIQPKDVDEIEFSGDTGKTHVTFRSSRHASLAFDALEGVAEQDLSNRLQKKVYLRSGSYIRVRKMAFENRNRNSTPNKNPSKEV
jgi:RNA exonuclease 1